MLWSREDGDQELIDFQIILFKFRFRLVFVLLQRNLDFKVLFCHHATAGLWGH